MLVVTLILCFGGVSKSAKLNFVLVCLKMGLLIMFLCVGATHVNPANWTPFMPMGWEGVLKGAAIAVFSLCRIRRAVYFRSRVEEFKRYEISDGSLRWYSRFLVCPR